jgi:hypothetical protein
MANIYSGFAFRGDLLCGNAVVIYAIACLGMRRKEQPYD